MRPKIFVGSSTEGKPLADCVVAELSARGLDPMPWFDFFKSGRPPLQELEQITLDVKGAILVGSADDRVLIRNRDQSQMRDNVLFEYALFSGHIGRSKCALLLPDIDDFRVPSDLLGLSSLDLYHPDKLEESAAAAVTRLDVAVRADHPPEDEVTKAKRLLSLVGWIRENVAKSISAFHEAPSWKLFSRKLEAVSEFVRKDVDQLQLRGQHDHLIGCINDAADHFPGLPSFGEDDPELRETLRALVPLWSERDFEWHGGVAPHPRVVRVLAEEYLQAFGFRNEPPYACRLCDALWQARRWEKRVSRGHSSPRDDEEEGRFCAFRGALVRAPRMNPERYALTPDLNRYAELIHWNDHTGWYSRWDEPGPACAFFPWSEGVAQAATVFESYMERRIKSETQKLREWSEHYFDKINASIVSFERALHERLFGKL